MRLILPLLSLCTNAWACTNCNGRSPLKSPLYTSIGSWYPMSHCSSGMYATGMQIKYQRNQGKGDDTALNGVRLFYSCSTSHPILSRQSAFGSWQNVQWCSSGQAIIGYTFRHATSIWKAGADNVALVNFRAFCGTAFGSRSVSHWLEGSTDNWGYWSPKNNFCPQGYFMCGIQSQDAPYSVRKDFDNMGTTNLNGDCCEVTDIPCTPGYQILTLGQYDNMEGKMQTSFNYQVKPSFSISNEYRTPISTENKIIKTKFYVAAENLANNINSEIRDPAAHVTGYSLKNMMEAAMSHESVRSHTAHVPRRTKVVVKQVYLTCGAYKVALGHIIEEHTRNPNPELISTSTKKPTRKTTTTRIPEKSEEEDNDGWSDDDC